MTANKGGIFRILQSVRGGSGRFYCNITKIVARHFPPLPPNPPPPPDKQWPVLNTNVAILKLPAAGFLALLGKLPLLCATRQSCETCERFAQLKTNSDPGRHRPYQSGSKWRPWYSSSQWWNLPHGVPLEQTVAPAFSEEQSELFRVCTVFYFLSLPSSPNHTRWEPDTLVGRHAYSLIKGVNSDFQNYILYKWLYMTLKIGSSSLMFRI